MFGPLFRLRAKKILLTYPQVNVEENAEQFLDLFKRTFDRIIIPKYAICCKETHADGNHHFHLYLESSETVSTKNERFFDITIEEKIYHPNVEVVKKTPWKVVDYVKKEGVYFEHLPENAPRCSLDKLGRKERNDFLRKHDPLDLYNEGLINETQCANMIKARETIARATLAKIKKREKPTVLWLWGSTGSGKTRTALELAEESGCSYWISHSEKLQWFDGYNGQEWVIFDDFRRNMCTLAYLLRLLDRYPMQVQIKGGYINWTPKVIIITSPVNPETAYTYLDKFKNEEKIWDGYDQLERRIDDVICFDDF